ncbi:MAG: carbohydrate ABC transporter permease [Actinomycetota bacterium]|nr:carbohydrate ABC transporter permease [Actinomycetota bacterium]
MAIRPRRPAKPAGVRAERRARVRHLARIAALVLVTALVWLPLVVTVSTSLRPRAEITTTEPSLIPGEFTLGNYSRLFRVMDYGACMKNSLVVAGCTAAICLLVSSLAAYSLVWLKFRGKRAFLALTLLAYTFPQILLVIPLFVMCFRLGLLDTRFALVLTYLSFVLPFGIWMHRNYFQTISGELVGAALTDGCGYLQCMVKVVLPISLPAMATVLTFSFVAAWNEYMFANILVSSDAARTASVGLQTLIGSHSTDYGMLTAASVVMALPVIIFFLLIQGYFREGLTMGSMKG